MKKITLLALLFFHTTFFSQTIELEFFAGPFSSPVEITHPNNDNRFFVLEKGGYIKIVNSDGSVSETPFLDITSLVLDDGERGLLGLAFHPNYNTNGFFYINYINLDGNTVIARYSVSSNPNLADSTSVMIMMTINQPFAEHKGGTLKFANDGYLYISLGDGGGGGDPFGSAQNLTIDSTNPSRVYLGKILRIDVDSATPYGIPSTNPLIGQTGKEEIWALGLRNPWKFSFNRLNGDMWLADVGQGNIEEINKIVFPFSNSLTNFGWRCFEGNTIYNDEVDCPSIADTQLPFTQYDHSEEYRCSVTGGYFYTGSLYPNFQNKYFFADFCSAKIGMVDVSGTITWSELLPYNYITTFGEDINGELYIANIQNGNIYKIIDSSLNTSSFDKTSISVYPNPASDELFIKNENNIELSSVKITDLTGKTVLNQSSQLSSITISNLSKGMYFVTVETKIGNTVTSKIIKQ
ncbi:MAG TPA: PQQ-dependent sugar dehydrogenase [Flavobacterium sp.]|jgi:glucose/arabinose dehydrogenase|nr:PQQ-dependent sugar dehydrogenase [Flavobacterium sp.]